MTGGRDPVWYPTLSLPLLSRRRDYLDHSHSLFHFLDLCTTSVILSFSLEYRDNPVCSPLPVSSPFSGERWWRSVGGDWDGRTGGVRPSDTSPILRYKPPDRRTQKLESKQCMIDTPEPNYRIAETRSQKIVHFTSIIIMTGDLTDVLNLLY